MPDWWQKFWDQAPRQLAFTREGKVVVGIAIATGFAAINTGSNLLFLGWGLLLSAIMMSGILSEAALRSLTVKIETWPLGRVDEPWTSYVDLHNRSKRVPSFAIEVGLHIRHVHLNERILTALQLRLDPKKNVRVVAHYTPNARGFHAVPYLTAETAYPFGFFRKSRRYHQNHTGIWVAPKKVPLRAIEHKLLASLGYAPSQKVGLGDEFFALRPFRTGDDPRHLNVRRSAQLGSWITNDLEAHASLELVLELAWSRRDSVENIEEAIALLGTLAEEFLRRNYRVGVFAPGIWIAPDQHEKQTEIILAHLARLDLERSTPHTTLPSTCARIAIATPKGEPAPGTSHLIRVGTP